MRRRVFLEVSDVVEYFSSNMTASGIQRVQLEFIRVFARGDKPDFSFVIESKGDTGFIVVDNALLLKLVAGIDDGSFTRRTLSDLLLEIRAASTFASAEPGDIFFISGAFWASSTATRALWGAKARGAQVGFLCYDLIPIRHPEFCDEGLVRLFTGAFASICHVVDFIFTISEFVKRDVEAYLAELGLKLPVIALPLAHELAPTKGAKEISPHIAALTAKPFVLFVSTIEARKNHVYALTVWQRLVERAPELTPNMIWVGRPGWLVGDLMERLRRLDNLGGRIKIVNNLTDNELGELYRRSLFSFYPSLVEGWGLPVAESLMFGKTAVSSSSTSLPEVGGDFVTYIDPDNVTQGVDTVLALLREPKRLQAMEQKIKTSFKPRLWRDVCDDMVTGFATIEADRETRRALPTLETRAGLLYGAGTDVAGSAALNLGEQAGMDALFDPGWYAAEAWGRWMKGLEGGIVLSLPEHTEPRPYIVLLRLQIITGWRGRALALHTPGSGEEGVFKVPAVQPFWVRARITMAGGEQKLVLRADRIDGVPGADPRRFSIGLLLFGFAPEGDASAVAALEHMAATGKPLPAPRGAQVLAEGETLSSAGKEQLDKEPLVASAEPPAHVSAVSPKMARLAGSASALKPRKVLMDSDDWRVKLVRRAWSEGPRMFTARVLTRTGKWLGQGRLG